MQMMWMGGSGSAQCYAGDGMGSIVVVRANGTSVGAGGTTFTSTSATDTGAGLWTLASTVVGDVAMVATGEWGIITAVAAPTITVDTWRSGNPGQHELRRGTTPAAAGVVTTFPPTVLANVKGGVLLHRIVWTAVKAADTFSITKAGGTAYTGCTWTFPTTPQLYVIDFGNLPLGGLFLPGIFGYKASATTTTAIVEFSEYK